MAQGKWTDEQSRDGPAWICSRCTFRQPIWGQSVGLSARQAWGAPVPQLLLVFALAPRLPLLGFCLGERRESGIDLPRAR